MSSFDEIDNVAAKQPLYTSHTGGLMHDFAAKLNPA
jgi:hypothetical protein